MIKSKRKPILIETDRGKDFYNDFFQSFLNNNNIKHLSRKTYLGAVFPDRFNRTFTDLLKRSVFAKAESNWVDLLPTITKQYNNGIHSSTKLTPIQASLKKNEGFAYNKLLNKRRKIQPKFQVNDFVRVADLKKTFSKGDTTNWSFKFYKIREFNNDTIPSYRIDNLKERFNETLRKKIETTTKENKCYEKIKLRLNQIAFVHR